MMDEKYTVMLKLKLVKCDNAYGTAASANATAPDGYVYHGNKYSKNW